MSNIIQIQVSDKERWNNLVRSFSTYDVFYLNEYVSAFMNENPKNGEPILLYYSHKEDRAINVVFQRDVSLDPKLHKKIKRGEYLDLVSPYGYGGFWGEISDYEALNKAYNEFCILNHYICEFVRFELFSDYHKHYDGEVETRTHNIVRSLDLSLDSIWMDFKQKVRKNVKKANGFGLQIIIENTDEHLSDFLDIYYSTMDRTSAESEYYFSKEFYETINSMRDNIMYFHVVYDGLIIATELIIFGSENCYSYLGGTRREYFELRPNDFLKYEIIKWAKEKGFKNFVLGGGYGSDDGIYQYKSCLAPNGIVDFYIGRKIFDEKKYNDLVSIRFPNNKDCIESSYFPKYRA